MKKTKCSFRLVKGSRLFVTMLLSIICVLCHHFRTYAQDPDMYLKWANCMNNASPFSGNAYGRATTVDASGNVYVAGIYTGTVDFDPGTGTAPLSSVGGLDIFFAKYDINGNFILAKSIGGNHSSGDYLHALAVDGLGNIFIGGEFYGTADFDPGAGVANLTSSAQTDGYVAKYDAAGNFVFVNHFSGGDFEVVRSLATDFSGNVVAAGYHYGGLNIITNGGTSTLGSNGIYDAFLIKFDATGNTVFAKRFGNFSYDNGYAVATDVTGNVYVAGDFISSIDLGGGFINAPFGGGYDVFVAKFSPTGTYIFGKVLGGSGEDWCNGIAVDASGHAYLTGYFSNNVDFDPGFGTYNLSSAGGKDAYILKLGNNGDFEFAKRMGGTGDEYSNAISIDSDKNAFITGSLNSPLADFDPGPSVFNLSSAGAHDAYIAKYDALGNYLYARSFGAAAGDEIGSGIATFGNYNVFATGYFTGVVDFHPEAEVYNLGSPGTQNSFTIRLTKDFQIVASSGSNGSVTPVGTSLVLAQTNKSYNITPDANYCIVDVLVDGASIGPVSVYTFSNVTAAHTISATFSLIPHWYKDFDNDGYGDILYDSLACSQPSGYVSNSSDCIDANSLIHPNALEVCNGIDDDCDQVVDDSCVFTLNLRAFIEGLYTSNEKMRPVLFNSGVSQNILIADSITVELHDAISTNTVILSKKTLIDVNGYFVIHIPYSFNEASMYIVIKYRNTIEVWSKLPVTINTNLTYDFTR